MPSASTDTSTSPATLPVAVNTPLVLFTSPTTLAAADQKPAAMVSVLPSSKLASRSRSTPEGKPSWVATVGESGVMAIETSVR